MNTLSSNIRACAVIALAICAFTSGVSQTRRAVLVGINTYKPEGAVVPHAAQAQDAVAARPVKPAARGSWRNLDGCLNDVDAMHDVLIARYGFAPANVVVLKDTEATRERIFSTIRERLVNGASPGDEVLFFYAGHGSQVTNSKSSEPDKKDETTVPADAYSGAPDIRDKEIKKIFNEVLDKGVKLTLIFDCCHSGSIARGLPGPEKIRFLEPDPRDVADPSSPEPPPEERGAVVLSSTQDADPAAEAPPDEQGLVHGAFSLALLKVINTAPPGLPVDQIFYRTKAMMQAGGRRQEPVKAGPADRLRAPLFGGSATAGSGRTRIPVVRVSDEGEVLLQGGIALGLTERCELKKADTSGGGTRPRLRIREVLGLSRSKALVIQGNAASIKPGDVFEIDRWVGTQNLFRVWLPPSPPSDASLRKFVRELAGSLADAGVDVVEDPTAVTPTHVVQWTGSSWVLSVPGGKTHDLGKSPTGKLVVKNVKASGGSARVFLDVPLSAECTSALRKNIGSATSPVQIAKSSGEAVYVLAGRQLKGELSYAWLLPNATGDQSGSMALPVRSDWISGDASTVGDRLADLAICVSKVYAWNSLVPPADEGAFPYHLALKNSRSGEIKTVGPLVEGEPYGLILAADGTLEKPAETRYVYVFAIDSYGSSTLLFPRSGSGNAENRIPYETAGETKIPTEIPLGRKTIFTVGPPFGTDTYILLTTEQAIPDPDGLAFEGVRSNVAQRGDETPLSTLLAGFGATTRGPQPVTPADWSIERLLIQSVPR